MDPSGILTPLTRIPGHVTLRNIIYLIHPLLILITIALGVYGFYQHALIYNKETYFFTLLYQTLQLFVLKSGHVGGELPLSLQIARFMAPFIIASGLIFVTWYWLINRHKLFKTGFFFKDHIIICGLNKKAVLLFNDILKNKPKQKIVVIEKNVDSHWIDDAERKGVVVISGNAENKQVLKSANIAQATVVLALTKNDETNINIANASVNIHASDQVTETTLHKKPSAGIQNKLLRIQLQVKDFYKLQMFDEYFTCDHTLRPVEFRAFNLYQIAAARMVDAFSPDKFMDIKNSNFPQVHILVYGLTQAGIAVIIEAAKMYHFANHKKLKISVSDYDLNNKLDELNKKYPALEEVVDIEATEPELLFKKARHEKLRDVSLAFVCTEDNGETVHYAFKLCQFFYKLHSNADNGKLTGIKEKEKNGKPLVVGLLSQETSMSALMDETSKKFHNDLNIQLVDMFSNICTEEIILHNQMVEDTIARQIHNFYQSKYNSDDEWEDLNGVMRDSNRLSARHLHIKLRYLNASITEEEDERIEKNLNMLKPEEPGIITKEENVIAQMEQRRWIAEKKLKGYLKYPGHTDDLHILRFVKNNLHLHHLMVDWQELQEEEKEKDIDVIKNAKNILSKAGLKIVEKEE